MNSAAPHSFEILSDYDCISNPDVFSGLLKVLMAFAYRLIGDDTVRLERARHELAYDFAMEAIKRHLENPGKFNSERNPDLVKYLKYYIVRQLITNYKGSKGQRQEIAKPDFNPDEVNAVNSYLDRYDIHDSIDLKQTLEDIQSVISDDPPLLELFEFRYLKEYSRGETIIQLGITQGEYNNRIRRLDTVFKRVIKSQT